MKKNITLKPIKEDPFSFLKEGGDKDFQKAMNSIQTMYDDIFKTDDSHLNSIFDGLKVDNNPFLDPISDMVHDIFPQETVKPKVQFKKM